MIRGRQPQPGAKIEIDIPPGSPPRNATMRAPTQATAPPQTQPQPQAPQTPLPQAPPAQGQAPAQPAPPVPTPPQQPATPQAPVDSVDVSPRPAPSPQPAPTPPVTGQPQTPQPPVAGQPAIGQTPAPMPVPQLPPLTPGKTITLTPLPPESVKDGDPVPNTTVQPSGTGTNVQTSNVKAPGMIISTLINAVRTVLPASIPLPGLQTPATQTTAQPAQGTPVQTGLPPVMIMPLQERCPLFCHRDLPRPFRHRTARRFQQHRAINIPRAPANTARRPATTVGRGHHARIACYRNSDWVTQGCVLQSRRHPAGASSSCKPRKRAGGTQITLRPIPLAKYQQQRRRYPHPSCLHR